MLYKPTEENIKKASLIIKSGGLVAFPTETVYGLGADVFNPGAVVKIFKVKNRPFFDPLIVHISDFADLKKIVKKLPFKAKKLIDKFWPGPLTIVVEKKESVPGIVTAGLKTVAVRMPDNKIALKLIKYSETPIAAPSANPFGYISPTTAKQVEEMIGDKIDMILDGGKCKIGVESTIIYFENDETFVLRPGGLPLEEIESVIGKVKMINKTSKRLSPGLLKRHYAPKVKLVIKKIEEMKKMDYSNYRRVGFLFFKEIPDFVKCLRDCEVFIKVLSTRGELEEAASNLFEYLYDFDKLKVDIIIAEPVPEKGLGIAIMNRFKKAQSV